MICDVDDFCDVSRKLTLLQASVFGLFHDLVNVDMAVSMQAALRRYDSFP